MKVYRVKKVKFVGSNIVIYMSINLIGQGYCPTIGSSVAAELIGLFKDSKYNSFTCVVAFASRDAVSALKPYIMGAKRAGWSIRIIVGIDQGGTSAQALEELLSLDVSAQILHLDNPGNSVIFHPKIYLFEGNDSYAAIIGSNNLTINGLARNMECATLIKGGKDDSFYEELYKYWGNLFNLTDTALRVLTTTYIEELSSRGVVPNERVRSKQHDRSASVTKGSPLSNPFEVRATQPLPDGFYPKSIANIPNAVHSTVLDFSNETDYEVYVTEIPKGGARWKQINVPIEVFLDFFGAIQTIANDGTRTFSGMANLIHVNWSGMKSQPHQQQLVKVKSSNYRVELNCPETRGPYPKERPIAIYVKTGLDVFEYVVLLSSSPCYSEVKTYLEKEKTSLGKGTLNRLYMSFSSLRDIAPGLPFFIGR